MQNNERGTNGRFSDWLNMVANGDLENMLDNAARMMIVIVLFLPSLLILSGIYNDPRSSPEIANIAFQTESFSRLFLAGEVVRQWYMYMRKFFGTLR